MKWPWSRRKGRLSVKAAKLMDVGEMDADKVLETEHEIVVIANVTVAFSVAKGRDFKEVFPPIGDAVAKFVEGSFGEYIFISATGGLLERDHPIAKVALGEVDEDTARATYLKFLLPLLRGKADRTKDENTGQYI